MPSEAESLAHRWIACWRPDRLSRLSDLVSADYVHHTMAGEDLGLEGFVAGIERVFTSFPDIQYEIVHSLSEGELAAVAVVGRGSHQGTFLGIPATGSRVSFRGFLHCRVRSGRIHEDWDVFDLLTPLLRLGATISPAD